MTQAIIDLYFDDEGRLRCWPPSRVPGARLAVFTRLVQVFDEEQEYSEGEAIEMLSERYVFDDVQALKREILSLGLLQRMPKGLLRRAVERR